MATNDIRTDTVPAPMNRTNVVFSLTHTGLGGVTVLTFQLVEELRRMGWDAEIVVTSPSFASNSLPEREWITHLTGHDLPQRWCELLALINSKRTHIFVANTDFTSSAICSVLPGNCHSIGVLQSDELEHYDHLRRLGHYWDAVVVVSPTIAFQLVKDKSPFIEKVEVITNGIATSESRGFVKNEAPLALVYAGRLAEKQKRCSDLIPIVAMLQQRSIDFTLHIFGSGPSETKLREGLADAIKSGQVVFEGPVSTDELISRFAEMHVFLQTSEYEGLSISLLQAMSAMVVPVVTRTSGSSEVVHEGLNGHLVPIGGIEELVNSIALLDENRERLGRMRNAARATVLEQYTIHHTAQKWISTFERLRNVSTPLSIRKPYVVPDYFGINSVIQSLPFPSRLLYKVVRKLSPKAVVLMPAFRPSTWR